MTVSGQQVAEAGMPTVPVSEAAPLACQCWKLSLCLLDRHQAKVDSHHCQFQQERLFQEQGQ